MATPPEQVKKLLRVWEDMDDVPRTVYSNADFGIPAYTNKRQEQGIGERENGPYAFAVVLLPGSRFPVPVPVFT